MSSLAASHPASWAPAPAPPPRALHGVSRTATTTHPASVQAPAVRGRDLAKAAKEKGNKLFQAGSFAEAVEAYGEALDLLPPPPPGDDGGGAMDPGDLDKLRAVFYCNRAAALWELKRYEDVVEDCGRSLKLDPGYVKAYVRRARAHEALDQLDEALADWTQAAHLDASAPNVRVEQARLDKAVKEKNEKLKDEMLGKLKDLGNSLLGRFGMSLDNFKMVQDPATGSYSVSYQS